MHITKFVGDKVMNKTAIPCIKVRAIACTQSKQ